MKHIKLPKKNTVMPSGEYVIIRHLIKKFGEDTVLSDINMTMEEGMVYGISGNNGIDEMYLRFCSGYRRKHYGRRKNDRYTNRFSGEYRCDH